MMSFRERMEYLEEVKRKNSKMRHPDGTYVAVKVSKPTQKVLDAWSKEHNIPNPIDPKDFHTTIAYSRKGIPDVVDHEMKLPIKAKIKEWKIFPSANGKRCLVAVVNSPELEDHHEVIHATYGATYDYPDYIPHITFSYDYGSGKVPTDIPDVEIVYDRKQIEPLDPEFTSAKED